MIKKLLVIIALCASVIASAATTVPIQLLNPTGSTSGQAILSTGPSGAPAWSTVPLTSVTNTWAAAQTFSVRPTFNGATPWDSANLNFASPPNIGLTTPAVGSFSALNATGNDALLYSYSGAQSIASNVATTVAGFTKVYDRLNANFNATTGTFTAPATGYYQVGGSITFSTAAGVASAIYQVAVVANGVTVATGRFDQGSTTSTAVQVPIPFTVVSLAAGQTIILQVTQNTGVSRSLSTAAGSVAINRLP